MASPLAQFLLISFFCLVISTFAIDITYDGRSLKLDGQRKIIMSGSIHYPRSTPQMWPDLINKAKDGGLNAIETYVFWNAHEPEYRQYNFLGRRDLVKFIKTIQAAGLYAILRIGPYACAEWTYGGFPVWLHNLPNIKLRTKNQVFMNEMQNFTTLIVNMMRSENLFASQGGPIILAQIENEYGNVMEPYGNDGKEYVKWCAQLAESYKLNIPWVMCQQNDAPQPMINTCNGWYCDDWSPNNKNSPKMWTENWTGWFLGWGLKKPRRTAEDLAFAVARFFQTGGSLQNYYMYHGGTNFARTSGGPYITTSYDYDAPLDEYGNLNQPKWGHLKRLHEVLFSVEQILTNGDRKDTDYGNKMTATTYSYQGKQVCFLSNANQSDEITVNLMGNNYTVPAWSVSILPDCYTEVYNTAKVNSQTSVMVKVGDESSALTWLWRPEKPEYLKNDTIKGSVMAANQLLEQNAVTNDTSDYLWYLTSVNVNANDPILKKNVTLQVNTQGHLVHAFVNGHHVGSQFAEHSKYNFTFEATIVLKPGVNAISLHSATNGLTNYGSFFDLVEVGIRGPVKLIGNKGSPDEITQDLSTNKWVYKLGWAGGLKGLYKENPSHPFEYGWRFANLPSNKPFVWYKAAFKAPLGSDPVVVDLAGLGKGYVWVNGHNMGRYWPSYLASTDGCEIKCDYRGKYDDKKCLYDCGKPSQRWYHIPRALLRDDNNTLVLYEEMGGTPMNVKFETVTVGSICANAYENNTLELSCQEGHTISEIRFASFGDPTGACGSFKEGSCGAANTLDTIKQACVGKETCSFEVSEKTFGPTGCRINKEYRLAVEAVCGLNHL